MLSKIFRMTNQFSEKEIAAGKQRRKNILFGLGITAGAAAAAGTAFYLITRKLVNIALDRGETDLIHSSNGRLTQTPEMKTFLEVREAAAHELERRPCETVEISAHDGIKLVGHWLPCENTKRILIAMHGWRSSWTQDFGLISNFLHKNGCSVLFAEQRGQHNSGGDHMGFGLMERYDCLDWIRWINNQGNKNLPIYLCGISMGASTVLMAGGLPLAGNVHGIIADCGYTSPHAIWKHVVENRLHLHYDEFMSELADDICREKINIGAKDYSCADALAKCNVPVLFIHGTDDDFVPIEMTYENYKACVAPKRLLIIPGAGHGMSYALDKARYEHTLRHFWSDFD